MYISKLAGGIISLLFAQLYIIPYYRMVAGSVYAERLMYAFIFGVILLFSKKIVGSQELMWFDKGTGGCWSEGWCLLPRLIPLFQRLGANWPWGLRENIRPEDRLLRKNVAVSHNHDDRRARFQVNTTASIGEFAVIRILSNLLNWFFFEMKELSDLGLRIVLALVPIGFCVSFFFPIEGSRAWNVSTLTNLIVNSATSIITPSQEDESFEISVELKTGPPPKFPAPEMFVPTTGDAWNYRLVDGIKYIRYLELGAVSPPIKKIEGQSCLVIPAAKEMLILSTSPPLYAANMEVLVFYTKKFENMTLVEKTSHSIRLLVHVLAPWKDSGSFFYSSFSGWQTLRNEWSKVDAERFILIRALPKSEISGKVLGGMACF